MAKRDRIKAAKDFIRLLGQGIHQPSEATEIELGRLVIANSAFFIALIENATTTVGVARDLHRQVEKYITKDKSS